MFDVLKNLLSAFCFHSWTKSLPRHSRRPCANRHLKSPLSEHLPTVEACWQAYEIFVLCATIAQGLLQLIGLQFGSMVWQHHRLYLRTQSRELTSEKTVKQVPAPLIIKQLIFLPKNSIIAQIRCYFAGAVDDHHDQRRVA